MKEQGDKIITKEPNQMIHLYDKFKPKDKKEMQLPIYPKYPNSNPFNHLSQDNQQLHLEMLENIIMQDRTEDRQTKLNLLTKIKEGFALKIKKYERNLSDESFKCKEMERSSKFLTDKYQKQRLETEAVKRMVEDEKKKVESKSEEIRIIQQQSKIFDSSLMDKLMASQTQIMHEGQKVEKLKLELANEVQKNITFQNVIKEQWERIYSLQNQIKTIQTEKTSLSQRLSEELQRKKVEETEDNDDSGEAELHYLKDQTTEFIMLEGNQGDEGTSQREVNNSNQHPQEYTSKIRSTVLSFLKK